MSWRGYSSVPLKTSLLISISPQNSYHTHRFFIIFAYIIKKVTPSMNKKLKLALLLFLLGFAGILSTLTVYATVLGDEQSIYSDFASLWNSNWIYLVFPTINLVIALAVGTLLYDKVNLRVPLLERLIDSKQKTEIKGILPYGIVGGLVSGVLITIIIIAFAPTLPPNLLESITSSTVGILPRVLNGAITGEILHRFGFMTLLVWLGYMMSGKLTPNTYWTAIIVSALLFGAGQLTPALILGGTPSASLLFYHLFVSATSVTIYSWLYWKKGLEAAIIAHVVANIILFFTPSMVV